MYFFIGGKLLLKYHQHKSKHIAIFHVVIGSKMTKEERTSLHRYVRLAFPHLRTETIQSEQEVSKLLKDLSK